MAGSAGKAQYEVPPGQAHEVPAQLVLDLHLRNPVPQLPPRQGPDLHLGSPRLARKPLTPHLVAPCHPRFSNKNSP